MANDGKNAIAGDDAEGLASLAVSDAKFDLPRFDGPIRSYVICASPRSGSTLLTTLLHGTGRMGVPAEYLNPRFLQAEMSRRFDVLLDDGRIVGPRYLQALLDRRTTANGVFGIKILMAQMQSWTPVQQFRGLLQGATFLWLRRRDKQAQALSMAMAQATQVWHRQAGDPEAPVPAVKFDAAHLRRSLGIVLAEDFAWRQFFAINRTTPISVDYEDLVADPGMVCRSLADAVGVGDLPSIDLEQAITKPTAGTANAEWRRRWDRSLRFR
ncbi:LPS sulfotransferase NodH [Stella humosa]|uniref:LPS sulfotransferase NodH n=1 Tax=Stella humosa TaxID=94 RepID=A0A3N1MAE1_9PROT|nr:Stf0 family sulfotransferase [Stella humosa]ROP99666.1 LPS sulfotransferase NodH [Stella humosa]BBK31109.1 hypothetical protein STHU_17430 [Stella humosa]